MRRTILLLAVPLWALTAPSTALTAQVTAAGIPGDSVKTALDLFSLSQNGIEVNGRFVRGNIAVPAGDTVRGPLVVLGGATDVQGVVLGDIYALWGDVIVHDGADVHGGVGAYRGRVVLDGGRVRGALTARPSAASGRAEADAVPITRSRALQLAAGWTAMFVVIGLLIFMLASPNIETTVRVLEQNFGRAFFVGVLGELGFVPALLLLCVALTVTIVGVLLVPFALVAAPVALAGIVTLGWLALALVAGRAIARARSTGRSRAESLRALTMGVVLLMVPWIAAAALHGTGMLSLVVWVAALSITWVAATTGLGAAILSSAGAARPVPAEQPKPPLQGWQTPTPVSGVAAARRPIPARPGATPQ